MNQVKRQELVVPVGASGILNKIKAGISSLFRPEEVEVTFRKKGDKVTYTYIKIEEKRVA